jgi:hypothetical protein
MQKPSSPSPLIPLKECCIHNQTFHYRIPVLNPCAPCQICGMCVGAYNLPPDPVYVFRVHTTIYTAHPVCHVKRRMEQTGCDTDYFWKDRRWFNEIHST